MFSNRLTYNSLCERMYFVRIIVMSDSHGDIFAVRDIIKRNRNADMFIHLGDGENEVTALRAEFPDNIIRHVAGNCDYCSLSPQTDIIVADNGVKIFCAHGHRHFVKGGTEIIRSVAKDNGCTIVLFGHTHCRYSSYEDGMYIMNPGSCSRPRDGKSPSFGVIEITDKGILTNITDLT